MFAIIGLGNPGKEYEQTRHNVGFLVLDELARRYGGSFTSKRSVEAELCEILIGEQRVLLAKPQTFMNASGRTFASIRSKYPVTPERTIVVYDDADLPFADVRYKASGGTAGHRGMESIISTLPRSASIPRVRVGIGRPHHRDIPLDQFVLGKWIRSEEQALPGMIDAAIAHIEAEVTASV